MRRPIDEKLAWLFIIAVGLVLAATPGCVRRRLLIRSNPPGAMVYVDNQPIGVTPCATDFVYYGTREIRLVKPGFETLTINQPIPAPWYEIPPLDFVSENLVPREIQDYRTLAYNLQPMIIKPSTQLLSDAEALRQFAQQGAVTPVSAVGAPLVAPDGEAAPSGATPPGVEFIAPGNPGPDAGGAGVLPPGGRPLQAAPKQP